MTKQNRLTLLLLHALPLDGTMWAGQRGLLPDATCAPTLYSLGDTIEEWAAAVLDMTRDERLVVVGCSVGGSCALQVAQLAPHRVAALVLIGTKARRRPDPAMHAKALDSLHATGLEQAWNEQWAPLFSPGTPVHIVTDAKRITLRQTVPDVARGVTAFHTRTSRDDVLSVFAGPVAVISGSDDRYPGPVTSQAQANMAANGQFYLIPGCGHYVPMERPHALNAILHDVIASVR